MSKKIEKNGSKCEVDVGYVKDFSGFQYLFVFDFGDRKMVSSDKSRTRIAVSLPKYVKSKKKWVFKVEVFEK